MIFRIKDTGIGIPKDQLVRIFDRFYQVDGSHTREKEGSGIGLALTKELVSLHGGTIKVDSNQKGTLFTVRLPLSAANYAGEETIRDKTVQVPEVNLLVLEHEEAEAIPDDFSVSPAKAPLLLLVEDNTDVRTFMREFLASQYRILEAKNGLEALDCALEKIPDLIISDIMMPGMDGMELCKRLKTELTDEAIETFQTFVSRISSPRTIALIEHHHGAMCRVAPDETAFRHRTALYDLIILSLWNNPEESEMHIRWSRDFFEAMKPYFGSGVYVNALFNDEGADRIKAAYGDNYERLVQIKQKYDPTNFFRFNNNIVP
ncbi:hypothetical protein BH23BAC1_BH23BAC1_08220 [soil metagenome]